MRATEILMGMPITVDVVDVSDGGILDAVFAYFDSVDRRFSTYRDDSEVAAINRGILGDADFSEEMRDVLALAEKTRRETNGYFDVRKPNGGFDPSGIVKGWAARNAAWLIARSGNRNFFVDAGGDVQSCGKNVDGSDWTIGVRNPFNESEIIKVVRPRGLGVATSGTYVRGQHIYNPYAPDRPIDDLVSLTVIAADVCEADRFATGAFAMGAAGIQFIGETPGLEGYAVDPSGRATMTSGFEAFVA